MRLLTEKKTKICNKCGIEKDLSCFYFHKRKDRPHGYFYASCKQCVNEWHKTDEGKEIQKNYRISVKGRRFYRSSGWKARGIKNPDGTQFGPADFERMVLEQGGKCAICGGANIRNRSLDVDHDHTTGIVRKLLCVSRNVGLGSFKDNLILLGRASIYINRFLKT
jgi:hypothetical protein